MKSKSYKEIEKIAKKLDKNLKANDDRLQRAVYIAHHDGSTFLFNNAFSIKQDDDWIIILTEHHGYHIYHVEDLHTNIEFVRVN